MPTLPDRPVRGPVRGPALPPPVVRAVKLFALSLGAAVLFSFLPLPWALPGLVFVVAAVAFGIVAMVAMRAGSTPALWTLTIVGILAAGSLILNYAAAIVAYDAVIDYQNCLRDAITITAEDRCSREFDAALEARMDEVEQWWERTFGG